MTTQQEFLNDLRTERTSVTVYLINGIKLNGVVMSFDQFSICLKKEDTTQLIFKHAIATILPFVFKEIK